MTINLLTKSDIDYISENVSPVDLDQVQEETTQLTVNSPADDSSVSTLTSGNNLAQNPISSGNNVPQSHFVTSHINDVQSSAAATLTNTPVVTLTNDIDSGFASSPINGSLTTELKSLHLVSTNLPTNTPALQGPFEIIGHTTAIDANALTDLQIIATNGNAIQVPFEIVSGNKEENGIHFLSLQVESDKSEDLNMEKENQKHEDTVTNITFNQPRQTSTPAVHMDRFDETILAGHLNLNTQTPVHGPTPDLTDISPVSKISVLPEIPPEMKSPDATYIVETPTTKDRPVVPASQCTEAVTKQNEEKKTVKKKEVELPVRKNSAVPANALNYMGSNKKKLPEIAAKENSRGNENHLEPAEKPHNETYCREWVSKTKVPIVNNGEVQDDSAFLSTLSSISSIKSDKDLNNFDMSSICTKTPEVINKCQGSVLESIDSTNVPKKESSQGMYVMYFLSLISNNSLL